VKVKNGEIYQAVMGNEDTPTPLSTLIKKELPISTSAKLNRLLQKLMPEVKAIEDSRSKLITQYGIDKGGGNFQVTSQIEELDEQGKPTGNKIPNPNWAPFVKDYEELMSQEIELDLGADWKKITLPLAMLEKREVFVAGSVLIALEKFVEIV